MATFKKGDRVQILVGSYTGKVGTVASVRTPPQSGYTVNIDGGPKGHVYSAASLKPFVSPPAPTPSPDGTSIPPASSLTDSTLAVWTLVSGVATRNGKADPNTFGISKLTYRAKMVVAVGADGNEYAYQAGAWVKVVGPTPVPDPTPDPTPTPTPGGLKKGFNSYNNTYAGLPSNVPTKLAELGCKYVRIAESFCDVASVNAWAKLGITVIPCFSTVETVKRLPMLNDFERGNEPYFGDEGGPSPEAFAKSFVDFATQAKQVRPGVRCWMPISVGPDQNFAGGASWNGGSVSGASIDRMFAANPTLKNVLDVAAIHPYCETDPASENQGSWGASVGKRLDIAEQALDRNGSAATLAIGEFGYSGSAPPASWITSLQKIVEARPRVEAIIGYQIGDQNTGGGGQADYGIWTFFASNYLAGLISPKPQKATWQSWFTGKLALRHRLLLRLRPGKAPSREAQRRTGLRSYESTVTDVRRPS